MFTNFTNVAVIFINSFPCHLPTCSKIHINIGSFPPKKNFFTNRGDIYINNPHAS